MKNNIRGGKNLLRGGSLGAGGVGMFIYRDSAAKALGFEELWVIVFALVCIAVGLLAIKWALDDLI